MTLDHAPCDGLGRMDIDGPRARHHFSFTDYYDPDRAGFDPLLVWNDDTIQAGGGFPMRGHRDMEIVAFARTGAISHRDRLGNSGRTEAGRGFRHPLEPGRRACLMAGSGRHRVDGLELGPRDGLRIADAPDIAAEAPEDGRIVFLDLP